MKRQLLFRIAILLVAIFFAPFSGLFNIQAQGGDARLKPDTKPKPTPKAESKSSKPVAPVTPTLTFNQESKGRLDPRASEKAVGGALFEEFLLNAASSDLLTFQVQSEGAPLGLQILDKESNDVAVKKDAGTNEFKINTPTGAVPNDGEYRVRVTGQVSGKTAIPYSLKVNRLGLTANIYNERFSQTVINFRENDPASVDETLTKLEELVKDDSSKAGAFEMLGIIYLYNKQAFDKAEAAMQQAIKLNGAAVIKISYDSQWRRMAKLKSGKYGWEDERTGWLRIRPGQVALTDPTNKTLANLTGAQIKELSKILTATSNLVTITADNPRKPFIFAPGSGQQLEADLVIKLIQSYVMGR
ncbi:MAG: hypothetical protein M3X11_07080 [Acidobacteriota bacterium]|nr:hypothetical protein [Acidobacteriota bacterium]